MEQWEQASNFSHEFVNREWKNTEKETDIQKRVYDVGRTLTNAVWKNDKEELRKLVETGKINQSVYTSTYDIIKTAWSAFKESLTHLNEPKFWNSPIKPVLTSMNQTGDVKTSTGANIEWCFDMESAAPYNSPSYPTLMKMLMGMTAIYEKAWQAHYCEVVTGHKYVSYVDRVA